MQALKRHMILLGCILFSEQAAAQNVGQELVDAVAGSAVRLVIGLVVALILANLLLFSARRASRRAEAEAEESTRPLEERPHSSTVAALLAQPRHALRIETLLDEVPRFSLFRFRKWTHSLFERLQLARVDGQWDDLSRYVSDASWEMVSHTGVPPEKIGRIRFVRTRLVQTTVAAVGTQVKVQLTAWVDETREGERVTFEIRETWSLARVDQSWRLLNIDRERRQPLASPMGEDGKPQVTHQTTRRDSDVVSRMSAYAQAHDGHDWDTLTQSMKGVFEQVQDAITQQQPEAVRTRMTETALAELKTWLRRYHRASLARKREVVSVANVQIVRIDRDCEHDRISCRITGQIRDVVEDAHGHALPNQRNAPYPFSEYWTFCRPLQGGMWRVDTIDDDALWVV